MTTHTFKINQYVARYHSSQYTTFKLFKQQCTEDIRKYILEEAISSGITVEHTYQLEDVINHIEQILKRLPVSTYQQQAKDITYLINIIDKANEFINVIKTATNKANDDDDENDPYALHKKSEALIKSTLVFPLYLAKYVQINSSYAQYIILYSNYLAPFLTSVDGIWSFRKVYRLLRNPNTQQRKTKYLFHLIKITQLSMGIAFMCGALSLPILTTAAILVSAFTIYKTTYIFYNTNKKIDEIRAKLIDLEKEKNNCFSPSEKSQQIILTQINYYQRHLEQLEMKKHFQKRAVYRSVGLFISAGLATAGFFCPMLGLVSFVLVTAITIHAVYDLYQRKKIRDEEYKKMQLEQITHNPPLFFKQDTKKIKDNLLQNQSLKQPDQVKNDVNYSSYNKKIVNEKQITIGNHHTHVSPRLFRSSLSQHPDEYEKLLSYRRINFPAASPS